MSIPCWRLTVVTLVVGFLLGAWPLAPALAQLDFKGKSVTMLIGSDPGGGTDAGGPGEDVGPGGSGSVAHGHGGCLLQGTGAAPSPVLCRQAVAAGYMTSLTSHAMSVPGSSFLNGP